MPKLTNNFESQLSGTTVTTSNTAGGGDTLDQVAIGANMTETFDSAHPAHGVNGCKFALTSTATATTTVGWTSAKVGSATSHWTGAFYVYVAATAIASSVRLVQFFNGATAQCGVGMTNGLQGFQFRNSADAAVAPLTGTMLANTLYRVEFDVVFSVAAGSGTINVFVGDSLTVQGTSSVTAQAFGASAAADGIKYGFNTAAFSATSGDAVVLDDLYLDTAGGGLPVGPGPYGAAAGLPQIFRPVPFMASGRI